ncbi:MAG: serine hydrolase [Ignavibacteriae bacterium]|nr:serine hydrolase [Ignavibacteria bacterium]MBI3363765.1 serine hydrolase [Ignavibacteriota bacterium]
MKSVAFVLHLCFVILPPALHGQIPAQIERRIQFYAAEGGGRIGVAAKNLHTGEVIALDADSLFPTASIIKLPVLMELFYQSEQQPALLRKPIPLYDSLKKPSDGVLRLLHEGQTLQLIDIATLMIVLSDNTATNYVIDQLGTTHDEKLEAVNARMQSLGLKHTRLLNKLYSWTTKKKTEEARRFGIGVSCPSDMAMLLEKLAKGEVVNKSVSDSIIAILRNQQDVTKAARLLPFMEDTTLWIANKTGTLDDVKNDVGIVSCSRSAYVYAIFYDEGKNLGEQVDNSATLAVARVSRLLFDYFTQKGN